MLLLASTALASTLSIPVRATYAESTGIGEDPVIVDSVLSATVAITNTTTGAALPTSGELTLKDRSAAGTGELSFTKDPSGSIRTWAVFLLDAKGKLLSSTPEIVDIAFGDHGDASIVARESGPGLLVSVATGARTRTGDDGTHTLRLEVSALGIEGAYVGVQELTSDTEPMEAHADMEVMTAAVYASFQGLDLDALVPLDTWKATVDGTLSVQAAVSGNTVEGGAPLQYDLSFNGPPVKGGSSALGGGFYCCFQAMTVRSKRSELAVPRLVLHPKDQIFESYDGAMDVIIDGDARGLEIGGILTATGSAPKAITDILQTLSPGDLTLLGTTSFTGKFPAKPEAQDVRIVSLQPRGDGGAALADWLDCTLTPTATTAVAGSKQLRWAGECLHGDDGRAIARAVRMTLDSTGKGTVSAELLGVEWQKATTLAFALPGGDLGVDVVNAPTSITDTTFTLPWTFPDDVDGASYEAAIYFFGTTTPLDFELSGGGWYGWDSTGDPTWSFDAKWPSPADAAIGLGQALVPVRGSCRGTQTGPAMHSCT